MSSKNVFQSRRKSSIPKSDVIQGLGVISDNYNRGINSANQRVSSAEHRAMQAEKRAMYAERRAGTNGSNDGLALLGALVLTGGAILFQFAAEQINKRKQKTQKKQKK